MPATERSQIIYILVCYGDQEEACHGRLVTYADGRQVPFGCAALIQARLERMRAPISPELKEALIHPLPVFPDSSPTSRKKCRKASCVVLTAAGAE